MDGNVLTAASVGTVKVKAVVKGGEEDGSDYTETFTIGIAAMPIAGDLITAPKEDQTVAAYIGETAALSLTVSPEVTSLQWYIDRGDGEFVPVDGAAQATYTTAVLTKENDGYRYYCIVSDGRRPEQSPTFTLKVMEKADIPATGDGHDLHIFAALALLSLCGMAFSGRRREEA